MSDTDSDPAPTAVTQFSRLFSEGFPKKMQSAIAGLALQRQQEEGPVLLGSKRNRQEMPAAAVRIRVWRKVGDSMPELQAVAVRLLSVHATSHCGGVCTVLIAWHAACEGVDCHLCR
jgi:hypothetical protein